MSCALWATCVKYPNPICPKWNLTRAEISLCVTLDTLIIREDLSRISSVHTCQAIISSAFPSILVQGSLHTARSIYQYEGVGAFYRGFLLNQMVWVPFNAVYLPLWEASKRACARFSGAGSVEKLDVRYELGSAFLCSAFAAGLTNPMVSAFLQIVGNVFILFT